MWPPTFSWYGADFTQLGADVGPGSPVGTAALCDGVVHWSGVQALAALKRAVTVTLTQVCTNTHVQHSYSDPSQM